MFAIQLAARALIAAAALAPTAAPIAASSSASATATAPLRGVFRVVLEEDGAVPVPATLVLEHRAGQLAASLLVDDRVSLLRSVQVDGETLRATVNTSRGLATLEVRVAGDAVAGTMTARKRAWKVTGERSA